MMPDLLKSSLMLPSLLLALLSTVGSIATAGSNPVLTATGAIVARNNMPEYCQREAAREYGVPFKAIKTDGVIASGGGFLVKGSAATVQRTRPFDCLFDSERRFMGVSGE